MTQEPNDPEAASGAPDDPAENRRDNAPASPQGADDPDPFAVLEALNAENSSLKDKLLRALADMENLRRRTEKETADARTYGVSTFARDVVTVADNMHRALETISPEEREKAEGPFNALLEGVTLIERDLLKTLERHGVKRIDPLGEKFDPHLHQAMFEVHDSSVPSGTVKQVVQAGFVIGDRVLRPALVGVSKGGPKAGPAEAQAADGDGRERAKPNGAAG